MIFELRKKRWYKEIYMHRAMKNWLSLQEYIKHKLGRTQYNPIYIEIEKWRQIGE